MGNDYTLELLSFSSYFYSFFMQLITEKPPFPTVYEWIGGDAPIRELVERFYDLMQSDTAYEALRSVHPADLQRSRDTLFWFLCGWMGGPDYYIQRFGHPRLRMRHAHVPIDIAQRDAWLSCMQAAMQAGALDAQLQAHLTQSFFKTADFMRNQGVPN